MIDISAIVTSDISTNTYFVTLDNGCTPGTEKNVLVVDPGDSSVVSALQSRGLTPIAVVLTHGHFDHVLGLSALRKAFPRIPIGIHPADKNIFGAGISGGYTAHLGTGHIVTALMNLPQADIMLNEGDTLDRLVPEASLFRKTAS
ncbi:MBL fold metallo-hydrolase, partial [Treponema endosymbiont of Eucomonympha sp.]|uniref:MBL fold metallo-hydrolase n=1 Tax=Treponema endosymbiont of Eucomonympha sp. TaxID=1580831 RepID=UPI001396AC16